MTSVSIENVNSVADGVDVHHQRNEGDDEHHRRGQRIDQKADFHLERSYVRPRVNRFIEARPVQHVDKHERRYCARDRHAEHGDAVRAGAPERLAEQSCEDGSEKRSERNSQEKVYVQRHGEVPNILLTLEAVEVFDIDRIQRPEKHDQYREADRRLCRGNGKDEKYENLPSVVAEIVRKSDEVGIDGKQHQFDRHQQHDHVPAVQKYADDADCEQDRAEDQIMGEAKHH